MTSAIPAYPIAERESADGPVTIWGVPEDLDRLKHHRDLGIARVVVSLPSAPTQKVAPILDRWAELMRRI